MLKQLANWWKRRGGSEKRPPKTRQTRAQIAAIEQARAAMRDRPALDGTIRIVEIDDPAIAAQTVPPQIRPGDSRSSPRHFVRFGR